MEAPQKLLENEKSHFTKLVNQLKKKETKKKEDAAKKDKEETAEKKKTEAVEE